MESKNPRKILITRILVAQLVCISMIVGLFIISKISNKMFDSFILSFLLGIIGSTVSMINTMKKVDDDNMVRWSSSLSASLLPMFYGGILAGVLYLLFISGVLSGMERTGFIMSNLFPDIEVPILKNNAILTGRAILSIQPKTITDLGKLLAWSFIAEYSESFVIGILNALQKRVKPDNGK